jgi:FixJ family two-component response regulator
LPPTCSRLFTLATGRDRGLGLGLTLSQSLAEAMGANLQLHVGQAPALPCVCRYQHKMTAANADLSPLIHLVDDDDAVRDSLALLISTIGLRVQTWADPLAFSTQFDRQGIGAIVLDVRMPGIGGLAVLAQLVEQGWISPSSCSPATARWTCAGAPSRPARRSSGKAGGRRTALEALQAAVRQHVRARQQRQADRDAQQRFAELSPRERQVLALIVQGLTNKDMARVLSCRHAPWRCTAPTCSPSCRCPAWRTSCAATPAWRKWTRRLPRRTT